MAKPTLRRVEAIDGNRDYTFSYVWTGLPVVGSILRFRNITNDIDDEVVFPLAVRFPAGITRDLPG